MPTNLSTFLNSTFGASVTVTDETTNATRYVGLSPSTSGSLSTLNVSSGKLTFNPSTGVLSVNGAVEIGVPNSGTQKFSVEYNSTANSLDFVAG